MIHIQTYRLGYYSQNLEYFKATIAFCAFFFSIYAVHTNSHAIYYAGKKKRGMADVSPPKPHYHTLVFSKCLSFCMCLAFFSVTWLFF